MRVNGKLVVGVRELLFWSFMASVVLLWLFSARFQNERSHWYEDRGACSTACLRHGIHLSRIGDSGACECTIQPFPAPSGEPRE